MRKETKEEYTLIENAEYATLLEKEKQHTAIIRSLRSVFFSMKYIDLEANTIQEIFFHSSMEYQYGEKENAKETLQNLVRFFVADEYLQRMLVFVDFDTIDARLNYRSIITQEYIGKDGNWNRCIIFPVKRDDNGKNLSVIIATRLITAEVKTLKSQNSILQALAIPYGNIYAINGETGEFVCYRMEQAMQERYGQKFFIGHYEDGIRTYIENEVLEDDDYLFDKVRTLGGVIEILSDKMTYSFNYRVLRNEKVQYFRCQFVKLCQNRNEYVLGFKNVDGEKRKEFAQQVEIEEALKKVEQMNEALQEEMEISESMSQEYHTLFKIDAITGDMTIHRTDGIGIESEIFKKLMGTGDDYDTVLGRYIDRYINAADQERIRKSVSLSKLRESVQKKSVYKTGYRRDMNGVSSFYEMNISKIADKDGKETFIMGIRDVDKEMHQQMKMTREMEMQREIIEGLGAEYFSVLLVDMDVDYVTVFRAENIDGEFIAEACKKSHNCWSKTIANYDMEIVVDENHKEFIEKLSLDYMRSSKNDYNFVYETARENMENSYFQVRISFVNHVNGSRVAVVGTRDIGNVIKKEREQERKLQEAYTAAEEASKAKTDFLFNMSHDIRTPMNAIMGFTELLEKHIDDKEAMLRYLEKIKTSNEFLLSLINNVLEMARIESGKESLDENVWNVYEFFESLLSMFEPQMKDKGLNFSYSVNVEHADLLVDETKIREILLNVLSNAQKYTPSGGTVTMDVSELPSDRFGYALYQIVIEDTGIGMSKEFLPHIFEEFSREYTSTVSRVNGTGLGMPIMKKLVDLMQGTVVVESELGKGSRFTITIPHRVAGAAETKQAGEYVTEYQVEDFRGKRILLAEDNELNAEIAITILEEYGFLIDHAQDGIVCVDMVEKAEANYYDVILMDVQMPDMDGYKATKIIRRLPDPQKANIPIIAMTANAFEEDRRNAFCAGMNAHVSKPIQMDKLKNTLGHVFARTEMDSDTMQVWSERVKDCEFITEFEEEYRKQGCSFGRLIYEACGTERILFADDKLVQLFGCESFLEFKDYVGNSFRKMIHKDDIKRVENEINNQVDNSDLRVDRVKYRIIRKDGSVRMVDDIGRKIFAENGVPVFFAYIVDITDSLE